MIYARSTTFSIKFILGKIKFPVFSLIFLLIFQFPVFSLILNKIFKFPDFCLQGIFLAIFPVFPVFPCPWAPWKISEEDVCCTDIRSVNCATGYIDSARYLVPLCLLERPCQRDVDVRCANNVSDWSLEHSFTVAWCVNAEDSSYIAVC